MFYNGFKFGSPENIYFLVALHQVPFFVFLYLITYFTKKATERDDENNFFLCFLYGV